jgi:hypothetical protein
MHSSPSLIVLRMQLSLRHKIACTLSQPLHSVRVLCTNCSTITMQHSPHDTANKGYHILLEKPMSVKKEECKAITAAVEANNCIFAVGHVMRYTPYSTQIKKVIDSGVLGRVINIQHLEPVGYFHFAHRCVRTSL